MNNVALITGASKGLGRAVAALLARREYSLILNARGAEALAEVARELERFTDVEVVAGDVGEIAEEIAALSHRRFGRVDVLINNASEIGPSPMPRLDLYPWDALLHVLRVNAVAPLHLTQLLLPQMRERGSGIVVNVTSDAGVNAYPGWGGYGASKAALEHISRTLAAELASTGVRIVVIDPGDMNTEMHRLAEPGADLSHLPAAEDVAPAIVEIIVENIEAARSESLPYARVEAQRLVSA
jgi:short-subunit dehydrogenase